MYRDRFSKKNSNFKTVRPKAAVPGGSIKPAEKSVTNVGKVTFRNPKTHSKSMNPTNFKSITYEIDEVSKEPIIIVDLYDNIEGFPLDYVSSEESQVAEGFKNTLLMPIYYPNGNSDNSAKPHIDDLQNMYQWLIMSKDLKTSDPSEKEEKVYCLRLHADTRTIIQEPEEDLVEVDLSVIPKAMKADEEGNYKYNGETYSVDKYINGGKVTIKYPVVWVGFYQTVENGEAKDPKFLKCYLENFRAEELYIGAGKVTEGVYEPFDIKEKVPESSVITGDSFSYYPTHATFVNVYPDNDFIDANDCLLRLGACIPGYEVYSEMIGQDKEDAGGMEILSRPLQYKDLPEIYTVEDKDIKNMEYDAAEEITFSLSKDRTVPIEVAALKYADSDFKVVKPRISFAYAYEDTDVDWINPEDKTKGGVLKKLVSQAICSKIKSLKGFHIKGPIKVYQIANGESTGNYCQLRYLNDLTLEDCLLEDEIKLMYQATMEYFWLYNVQLVKCDNQMKYYKLVNEQGIEIVGDQMVGTNGQGVLKPIFRGQSLGVSAYSPDNQQMFFASLDDLYGWLMQTHRVSCKKVENETTDYYSINYPEIILDETSAEKGTYTLKFFVESSAKVLYYNQGNPCKFVIKESTAKTDDDLETALVYELSKKIDSAASKTSDKYDTVQFHLCWKVDQEEGSDYTTGTGDNTKYWCDTYYGLIGSDYFDEISKIFLDVVKVETEVKSSNDEIESVVIPNRNTRYPEPEEMTAYLTKLQNILKRMPVNTKYVGEAAAVVAKYVLFENTRMPSYKPGDSEANPPVVAKGLDKNHPSSVAEATTTMYDNHIIDDCEYDETLKKYIGTLNVSAYVKQQFYCEKEIEGIKDGEFIWTFDPKDDEYSHLQLLGEISSLYEILNWLSMGSLGWPSEVQEGYKKGSVEEELYVATKLIIEKGIKYYGQSTPSTRSELTASMVDLAELEIYEEEAIYQVHYAITEDNSEIVVGLSVNGQKPGENEDLVKPFVEGFLTDISKDIKNYLGIKSSPTYTLDEFVAYLKPSCSEKVTQKERNRLIEYSQMLNTIQGQRDFIQKKGEKQKNFLLKFQQMSKGTIFEILKGEGDNYLSSENIYGYYISQGYGYTGTSDNVIKVPKGRKERRIHGDKGIIPTLQTSNPIRYRITRMPEYYSQEPLDWRNDNYFSNQIYTLNADNLNTIIDPEFEAREKTIYTKPDSTGTKPKYEEQEMIGFYTILVKEN